MMFDHELAVHRAEELCSLLRREEGTTLAWFKRMSEEMFDVDPYTAHGFMDEKERKMHNAPTLPKLFDLLQDCLLNLRWPDALQVLHKLIRLPMGTSTTIWKVGTELLTLESDSNRDLTQKLFNKMKAVAELTCKEVVMEFVVYLLAIGEKESISVMQEPVVRFGAKRDRNQKEILFEKLHKAYLGLMWYMEWKKSQNLLEEFERISQSGESRDRAWTESRVLNIEMQMKNFSAKAIQCFEVVKGVTGVWDIFVTKHVELLVNVGEKHEGETILRQYCETNPDNVNAHKYIYTFLLNHNPDETLIIEQLQEIAVLSPSDRLVLGLVDRLMPDKLAQAVPYLFKLLDYPVWQMETEPWQKMSTDIEQVSVVKTCWLSRQPWWPAFHFTKYWIKEGQDVTSLNLHKIITAALLCGKDCDFVASCSKYLSDKERKKLCKIHLLMIIPLLEVEQRTVLA